MPSVGRSKRLDKILLHTHSMKSERLSHQGLKASSASLLPITCVKRNNVYNHLKSLRLLTCPITAEAIAAMMAFERSQEFLGRAGNENIGWKINKKITSCSTYLLNCFCFWCKNSNYHDNHDENNKTKKQDVLLTVNIFRRIEFLCGSEQEVSRVIVEIGNTTLDKRLCLR